MVKRYSPDADELTTGEGMIDDPLGDWVDGDDYDALVERFRALAESWRNEPYYGEHGADVSCRLADELDAAIAASDSAEVGK